MESKMHTYVYGAVYDYGQGINPVVDEEKIRIYWEIAEKDNDPINGLEGIFESFEPIVEDKKGITSGWKCIIERKKMKWCEDKYRGRFIPFE